MGRFIYDTNANAVDIDDRTLAHVRIAIMTKLRRGEAFMFDVHVGKGSGHRSFWIHPSIPLQFRFFTTQRHRINRAWIELLIEAASGPSGLTIVPEPDEEAPQIVLDEPTTG
ncbi:ATP-dependent DNA ligase [Microbacterium sp. AZCO]|uniref:DUF7882 family protein n=1 Tax=Microbacterium sp. AZCO TaxID=3142976 RepID=UPI0031F34B91